MSNLKPCPFCGGEAEMYESEPSTARFNEGAVHFAVQCLGFYCQGVKANVWQISPEEAVIKWNDRKEGWVSVKDDRPVPKQGNKILGYNANDSEPYVFECMFDDGFWSNIGGEDFTHWMSSPELPSVELIEYGIIKTLKIE